MTLKWRRGDIYSFLYDADTEDTILAILRLHEKEYKIDLSCINEQYNIELESMPAAEWHAVCSLGHFCNKKANYYHKIRDHLPSVHELAKKAGI